MTTKTCTTCHQTKPITDFYAEPKAYDGLKTKCKSCLQKQSRDYHRIHPEIGRSYEQKRLQNPEYRAKSNAKTLARIKQNWPKHSARLKLGHAVRSGKIQRLPCEVCGEPKTHGHHDDYSKPLEVRWLCRKHHGEHHRLYP